MAQGLGGLGALVGADPGKLIYEMRRAVYAVGLRVKKIADITASGGDPVAVLKAEAEAKSYLGVAEANYRMLRALPGVLVPPDDARNFARAQSAVERLSPYAQQASEQHAQQFQHEVQADAWSHEPQWPERDYSTTTGRDVFDFDQSAMDRLFPGGPRPGGYHGLSGAPRRRRRRR